MAEEDRYSEEEESRGLDLQSILQALKRRWRVMVIAILVALVPALLTPFFLPAHYRTTATVSFEQTPAVMTFGADFMPEAGYRPTRLTSPLAPMMALAESNAVLGRVVDAVPDLGIEIEPVGFWDRLRLQQRLNDIANWGLLPQDTTPEQRRQGKIWALRSGTELTDIGGGSILGISIGHPLPSAASVLSNAVAESLVGYLLEQRNDASRAAIAWLRQKSAELRDEIQRREQVVVRLAEEAELPISASNTEEDSLQRSISDDLGKTRLSLLTAEMQLAALRPRLRSWAGDATDTETAVKNLQGIRDQYLEARERLENARSLFTEKHSAVQRNEARVEKLKRELEAAGASEDGSEPNWLKRYRALASERDRLQAQERVLEESLGGFLEESGEHGNVIAEHRRTARELEIDRELLEVVLTRLNETLLSAGTEHGAASILDRAVPPLMPVAPNRPRAIGIGLVLALLFGVGVGLLFELSDRSIYDSAEAARELGVPFLGSIPEVEGAIPPEEQSLRQDVAPAGESFRNLRTAIQFQAGARELRSLLITSAVPGEGKTTLALNLANSFASAQRRVLLMEADLRRPRVAEATGAEREPGLSDVLRGKIPLSEAIQSPENRAFSIITAGEPPSNPPELLNSDAFGRVMTELVQQFDMLVIDAPVLLAVSDAQLLAARVDGTLVVHNPGATDRRSFQAMRVHLERARARVLGLVFNKVTSLELDAYQDYLRKPPAAQTPES